MTNQVAILAPTEVLARQHLQAVERFAEQPGVRELLGRSLNVVFLAGSTPAAEKKRVKAALRAGLADLAIGTHALLEPDVEFQNLAFAVIDEQHRFGVRQREALAAKGSPHVLNLSATPIPRTLALTIYGDQELSIIAEKPAGRREIVTNVVPPKDRENSYEFCRSEVRKGHRIFVVCPLVEESDRIEAKAATETRDELATGPFQDFAVGLVHGRMSAEEKDLAIAKFKSGETPVLVATSVIEVGIDVSEATVMIIENADRFGLAQLHQLRGRVGRSDRQSYCFLFSEDASASAITRLRAMERTDDGFRLAAVDLKIRGPGSLLGTRQSGFDDLRLADWTDGRLVAEAREAAREVIDADPELTKHDALRRLLEGKEGGIGV